MMDNPFSLEGKTILVTGASSGIGKSIAVECSKLGAKIIISARDSERLNSTLSLLHGDGHLVINADLVTEDGINSLVSHIDAVDGAVLCAGKGVTLPVKFSSRIHMDNLFNLNFFSTVELVRVLYKKKKFHKGASIVLIDSVGGITRISPGNAIYGATKAALNSYMKFCAKEFSVSGIRVNCICPGMVDTPLIHRGTLSEEQLQQDAKKYPCGRYGRPEDVAYGAIYLLSDASSWVTGTSLFIDGGVSIV